MSGHGGSKKTLATRLIQLISLLVTFGVLYGVTKVAPELEDSPAGTVAAVGFLLLAGTLDERAARRPSVYRTSRATCLPAAGHRWRP